MFQTLWIFIFYLFFSPVLIGRCYRHAFVLKKYIRYSNLAIARKQTQTGKHQTDLRWGCMRVLGAGERATVNVAAMWRRSILSALVCSFVCFSGGLGSTGGTGIECEVVEPCTNPMKCLPMDENYYCVKKRFTSAAANGQPGTPGTDGKSWVLNWKNCKLYDLESGYEDLYKNRNSNKLSFSGVVLQKISVRKKNH